MTDHRLYRENQYLVSLLQAIDQGRSCQAEPWFQRAVELICKWFFEVEKKHIGQDDSLTISQIFGELAREDLPGKTLSTEDGMPEKLADDFDELIGGRGNNLIEAPCVYGNSLAMVCAEKKFQEKYLHCCWAIARQNGVLSEAFLEGLTKRIRAAKCANIPQGFLSIAAEVANNPVEYVYSIDKDRFSAALRSWNEEAKLVELWDDRTFQYFCFNDEGLGLFEAVRRVDAKKFTCLLEAITIPPAVESLLRDFHSNYDFDALLELLVVAPSMYEEVEVGCMSWNRKVVAPLLLNSIYKYFSDVAHALRDSPDELKTFQEQEVPEKLKLFTETILSRGDGIFLTINWMCHLIRQADRGLQRDKDQWALIPSVLDALAKGLRERSIGLNDFNKFFPELIGRDLAEFKDMRILGKGDLSSHSLMTGTDVFLSAFMVSNAESEKKTEIAPDTLLQHFKTLLVRQDYGMMTFSDKAIDGQKFWYPSLLISQHETPLTLWEESWGLLAHQRRRAKHHLEVDDYSADEMSYYLAGVGMCVVDWLISPDLDKKNIAFQVWETLFDEVFSCVLSLAWTRADHWRSLMSSLFCRLPLMLGQEACLDVTRKYLDHLGGDDELYVWCALCVCLNGIETKTLIDFMDELDNGGFSLRIKSYLEWEERPNEPRREKPLVDKVKEVFILAQV